MNWKERAIQSLNNSLHPVPQELNEIDWKSDLSEKSDRLAQHLSAFANQKNGGFLVFGVNNNASMFSITKEQADDIVQKLGNIARNSLEQPVALDHATIEFEGYSLLFFHVPESIEKPVHLRGKTIYDSYCRSAGQTRLMSQNEVKFLISASLGIPFEKQIARENLTADHILELLNYKKFFELIDKNVPSASDTILNNLREYGFCKFEDEQWKITNLGAILFATNLSNFPHLKGKSVVVRKYVGTNNRDMEFEQIGQYGYAIGFEKLIDYIMTHTQKGETRDVVRTNEYIYPRVAIREFVANALIHQDFTIIGMPITIEIFSNRLAITNPGAPLNDINRLIDLPPYSRNEALADTMLLFHFCEKRGSGVDYAIEAIEEKGLPPVEFTKGEQHTKIFLFPKKRLSEMTKEEKVMACYQHACLLYEDRKPINNQSVRERFGIDKNSSSVASRIIADTVEAGLIKLSDENNASKKFVSYLPFYG